ncbi:hypothetical protein ABE179_08980 [Aliarcobacter skirrowii]|jgi:hypothetical protein|uniref:hypothetical protein n=1 Tax=Aliarcobacter TaxID=2321111 RepID=UPI0021B1B182|nr:MULTISPECIES: hypothetical protein [Aliarcobacter]MCT7493996.1 hypothetical protein [Aliarcobacter cryaerophilus]MDX4036504.1 hypothetical protein [Aliarcobacter skirrowii]
MSQEVQILLLPKNYESEDEYYLYDNTLFTINKILNQSGVNSSYLDDKPIQLLEQRSVEWFLPTLYISYSLYIENKELYEVALELIKEYILKSLPFTRREESSVKLKVIVEKSKNKTTKSIEYNGPVEGLSNIKDSIEKICNE